MANEKRFTKTTRVNTQGGIYVQGNVNTSGGDFVGRDHINTGGGDVNIINIGSQSLQFPQVAEKTMAAIESVSHSGGQIHPGSILKLGDSNYVIQKVVVTRSESNALLQTFKASDQVMQENVGIWGLGFHSEQNNAARHLQRALERAQNIKLAAAAPHSHLASIRKILPVKQGLWVVSQWINWLTWAKYYPETGALPDSVMIQQILSRALDVCAALAVLHQRRVHHGGVSVETILINRARDAILIDPDFVDRPAPVEMFLDHFDPQIDLTALGDLLYRSLAHQIPGDAPIHELNLSAPADLTVVIAKLRSGSYKRVFDLKTELLHIKNRLRS